MKNKIQNTIIVSILLLLGMLYAVADYSTPYEAPPNVWDDIFYIIESFIFVLFSWYGFYSNNDKKYKISWIVITIFLLIRGLWNVKAAIWGLTIWEKIACAGLFIVDILALIIITYLPFLRFKKKWQH